MWSDPITTLDMIIILFAMRAFDTFGMIPYRKWAKKAWEADGKTWPWWAN